MQAVGRFGSLLFDNRKTHALLSVKHGLIFLVQNLLRCNLLFHDVISYITVMRLTVDRYIAVEGCNFRFPAVAAAVCGNFIGVVVKLQIAVYISGSVGMINIYLIAGKAHIAEAQMNIALTVNLHSIKIHFGGIAGNG